MITNCLNMLYSHTDYADIWPMYFGQMERYFKVFEQNLLLVEKPSPGVPSYYQQLYYANENTYPERLVHCLSQLDSEASCFFAHEDMFLYAEPNLEKIQRYIDLVNAGNYDFIRLIKGGNHKPVPSPHEKTLIEIGPESAWIFSIQPSIWKVGKLIELLQHHLADNIWELEANSQATCRLLGIRGAYSHEKGLQRGLHHWDNSVYPYIATAIVKGRWNTLEYNEELAPLFQKYQINPALRGHYQGDWATINTQPGIKIVAGYSGPSDATRGLINLCNFLNDSGLNTVFYGPDRWHLDTCKAQPLEAFRPHSEDVVIVHGLNLLVWKDLLNLPERAANPKRKRKLGLKFKTFMARFKRPLVKKMILSLQHSETPDKKYCNPHLFHGIHRLELASTTLSASGPKPMVAANLPTPLQPVTTARPEVAGVLGDICPENETHQVIQQALNGKRNKIVLFGFLKDPVYFYTHVEPLMKQHPARAQYAGYCPDVQALYASMAEAWFSANAPSFLTMAAECLASQTPIKVVGGDRPSPDWVMQQIDAAKVRWLQLVQGKR